MYAVFIGGVGDAHQPGCDWLQTINDHHDGTENSGPYRSRCQLLCQAKERVSTSDAQTGHELADYAVGCEEQSENKYTSIPPRSRHRR